MVRAVKGTQDRKEAKYAQSDGEGNSQNNSSVRSAEQQGGASRRRGISIPT